ncbi:MAG: HYC_CC_PP family protein [Mucilaginibacter sp.]
MKKLTVIVLSFIYLLSATGVSAERFYCCGKLTHTTYSLGEGQHNDGKTGTIADKCCKTAKQSFKIKDSHIGGNPLSITAKIMPVVLPSFTLSLKQVTMLEPSYLAFNANAPPERQQTPAYILNCTYRI